MGHEKDEYRIKVNGDWHVYESRAVAAEAKVEACRALVAKMLAAEAAHTKPCGCDNAWARATGFWARELEEVVDET